MKNKITKADIVEQIYKKKYIEKTTIAEITDEVFNIIKTNLINQVTIELRGFGIFEVSHRKEKIAKNPKTGINVTVPAHNVAKFRPGKEIKNSLKKNNPQ